MAMQFRPLLLITLSALLIFLSLFNVSMASRVDIKDGQVASPDGFIALDHNDPEVVAAAKFAVDDYNKGNKKSATFNNLEKAAGQKFGGDKYEFALVINVQEDNVAYKYSATVLDEDGGRRLVTFRRAAA